MVPARRPSSNVITKGKCWWICDFVCDENLDGIKAQSAYLLSLSLIVFTPPTVSSTAECTQIHETTIVYVCWNYVIQSFVYMEGEGMFSKYVSGILTLKYKCHEQQKKEMNESVCGRQQHLSMITKRDRNYFFQ